MDSTEPGSPWRSIPRQAQLVAIWAAIAAVVGLVLFAAVLALAQIYVVIAALVAAMMVRAILDPIWVRVRSTGMRPFLAAGLVFVGFLAVVAGTLAVIGRQVARQFDDLGAQVEDGLEDVRNWLSDTFSIGEDDISRAADQVAGALGENAGGVAGRLSSAAGTASEVVAGVVLALFVAFFFLADGRVIWNWLVRVFPASVRETVDSRGQRSWQALVSYMKGILVVALADATLIGLALLILGVPLVLPLAVLTFFGAFIPLIGATLAGALAALVALVAAGPGTAILVVGVVLAVQWLDSDLLQPLILSRAVHLHPVAVALAITTGGLLAGLGGAVAATPFAAMVYAAVRPHDEEAAAGPDP